MELGVQTHFSQGWNPSLINIAAQLGVTEIRDSQPWGAVEKTPGVYTFTPALTNYMAKADALGIDALLTFASGNALYDSGFTPYTQPGRDAYASYIVGVLTKYGAQVEEIEIWNEFNTGNFTGPAGNDDAQYYTLLLKTVYETVKPLFPDVVILGASTNVVGVGAIEALFALGAGAHMDGVAIHPYRNNPEHVDDEIAHLKQVMAKYGEVKPIYATEFGDEFEDPAQVPDFMLKMVTLLASEHVAEAYWYALIDQKHFSNMGLYTVGGVAKPGAAAFAFIEKMLIPLGDPVRIDTGDDKTLVYRFGADTYVMWGSGRDVAFSGEAKVFNAKGEVIAMPGHLSMTPIVVQGAGFTLGATNIVADSLMEFGEGNWQYFAKAANGKLTELTNVDNDWTSYLGSKYTKPLRVNADSIAPAGNGSNPIQVVERYTSDVARTVAIDANWRTNDGDGVDLHILVNGLEIFSKIFVGAFALTDYRITLQAGDTLDFAMGPNQTVNGDSTQRRIVLTAADMPANVVPIEIIHRDPVPLVMVGTDRADLLSGDAGRDLLSGGNGDDTINGMAGDDILSGGIGRNVINGGDGFDMISYADAAAGVSVKLGATGFQYPDATRVDKLSSIEGVIGSGFDDKLRGSTASEGFFGGVGDDWIDGAGGADTVDGGAGTDTFSFESWSSGVTASLAIGRIQGVRANGDTLQLLSIERLLGSAYADTLTASDGGSQLTGGTGDDVLIGGAGDDILLGGKGSDTASYATAKRGVTVSLAIATAQATGAGSDTLGQTETLVGSTFADRLTGSKTADTLFGGVGDDVLTGEAGADLLYGGSGADRFVFANLADSKIDLFDTIVDFEQGDRIDLSAIDANTKLKGDHAFALVDAFSGRAGELAIVERDGGWFATGDVNGDGKADFGFQVNGRAGLQAVDFIL